MATARGGIGLSLWRANPPSETAHGGILGHSAAKVKRHVNGENGEIARKHFYCAHDATWLCTSETFDYPSLTRSASIESFGKKSLTFPSCSASLSSLSVPARRLRRAMGCNHSRRMPLASTWRPLPSEMERSWSNSQTIHPISQEVALVLRRDGNLFGFRQFPDSLVHVGTNE